MNLYKRFGRKLSNDSYTESFKEMHKNRLPEQLEANLEMYGSLKHLNIR